jgi:PIN domain nuclease of toxin-antitoxin system
VFEQAEAGRAAIYVPTIALVELGEASWRGRISLKGGFTAWVDALFSSGHFFPVDLSREIVERAEGLYAIAERGDRLIAATAAHLDCPLMTRDPAIEDVAGIEVLW